MYGLSTALAKSFASNQAGSSFLVLVFVAYSLFVMGMLLPVYVYTLVIEKESRVMLLMQIVRIPQRQRVFDPLSLYLARATPYLRDIIVGAIGVDGIEALDLSIGDGDAVLHTAAYACWLVAGVPDLRDHSGESPQVRRDHDR